MTPRRILILTNRVPFPLKDGGNLAMHAMIDGYHHAGWQVYLLSMNTSRHPVSREQLGKLYPYLAGFVTVQVDNRVKPMAALQNLIFSKKPNHAERFENRQYAKKLQEIIAAFSPDVVQLESIFLATYLPLIRDAGKTTVALRMHNVEYQIWHRLAKGTPQPIKGLYLKNLTRRVKRFEEQAWRQVDLLLPITETDAGIVRRLGIDTPMVVAPFGMDMNNLAESNADEKWAAYHIGAMDWLPNAEAMRWFLSAVWPGLNKALPQFRFYFAGRHMPNDFRNMDISGAHCMGEVRDASAFIADKRILIVPLRSGGGIRIKILEAMAAGKVVISTGTGMQGIDAIPGTHYLRADKPQEFTTAVKWCLDNKEQATQIGDNARALIRASYDQDSIIRQVVKELEGLVKRR